MSEPASISMAIARRYANAVFGLCAQDAQAVRALEADVSALDAAIAGSAPLRALLASPIHTRHDQRKAIDALARKMGLGRVMCNALSLMATKRRLFVVPQLVEALKAQIADAKGETIAEVSAAKALTASQKSALAAALGAATGKDVKIEARVDPDLVGGLIVRIGSRMIDTSIRARLDALRNTMNEVGQ